MNTLLKIGIVAPPWYGIPPDGYGGIERVCYYLARGLAENGHDVTLVGAGSGDAGTRFIPTYPEPASKNGTIGDPMPEMVHAARSSRELAELDLDLIHDHSLAGPLTARAPGPPTLITAHGPSPASSARTSARSRTTSGSSRSPTPSDGARPTCPGSRPSTTRSTSVRIRSVPRNRTTSPSSDG